jgi:signal transduction histidine kinase
VAYLTAHSDDATLQRAKLTEPFGYVLKLYGDKDLQTAIEIGLYKHKTERQLRENEQWLAQVILNLAANTRDSMPHAGRLVIATANADLVRATTRMHPDVKPGRYVLRSFADTVCGMSKDVLAHGFEPFFTTKAAGKGTGLGLASVYGVVKQSGATSRFPVRSGSGPRSGSICRWRRSRSRK